MKVKFLNDIMKNQINRIISILLLAIVCMSGSAFAGETDDTEALTEAPTLEDHAFVAETELLYAENFCIYNYEDGYSVIDIPGSGTYIVVPEGGEVPAGAEDMIVLQKPLDNIYLAASSAMSLFSAVDAVDHIRLSGLDESGWYIAAAAEAMQAGDMIYAGKYSEPDYELLISEDCDLAIESTMIFHTPKVKEMIEDLDIPVLVDRSSYESHPLGRTEWIKLYAVLVDKQEEAESFFNEQAQVIEDLEDTENIGKTVAFFYINTDGSVVIRSPEDYIPRMIEIGGGIYAFSDIETTTSATSFSITMEEFYATACETDYLIYNGSIEGEITSADELIQKDSLFADMKAVKEGHVWTVGREFYQSTDIVGQLIKDVNLMLSGADDSQMTFLRKVD